jgi:hypothetical protein
MKTFTISVLVTLLLIFLLAQQLQIDTLKLKVSVLEKNNSFLLDRFLEDRAAIQALMNQRKVIR